MASFFMASFTSAPCPGASVIVRECCWSAFCFWVPAVAVEPPSAGRAAGSAATGVLSVKGFSHDRTLSQPERDIQQCPQRIRLVQVAEERRRDLLRKTQGGQAHRQGRKAYRKGNRPCIHNTIRRGNLKHNAKGDNRRKDKQERTAIRGKG